MVAGDLSELLAAIEELDADAVQAWLDGCPPGTDLNSEGSLHRALSEAQPQDQSKHLAVLKVLLAAGVSPNVEDIGSDMLSPVSILVNHGVYDEDQMLDDDGHTALTILAEASTAATLNHRVRGPMNSLSALHQTCLLGDVKAVATLIRAGADPFLLETAVNPRDQSYNKTPFDLLGVESEWEDHHRVVDAQGRLLLERLASEVTNGSPSEEVTRAIEKLAQDVEAKFAQRVQEEDAEGDASDSESPITTQRILEVLASEGPHTAGYDQAAIDHLWEMDAAEREALLTVDNSRNLLTNWGCDVVNAYEEFARLDLVPAPLLRAHFAGILAHWEEWVGGEYAHCEDTPCKWRGMVSALTHACPDEMTKYTQTGLLACMRDHVAWFVEQRDEAAAKGGDPPDACASLLATACLVADVAAESSRLFESCGASFAILLAPYWGSLLDKDGHCIRGDFGRWEMGDNLRKLKETLEDNGWVFWHLAHHRHFAPAARRWVETVIVSLHCDRRRGLPRLPSEMVYSILGMLRERDMISHV